MLAVLLKGSNAEGPSVKGCAGLVHHILHEVVQHLSQQAPCITSPRTAAITTFMQKEHRVQRIASLRAPAVPYPGRTQMKAHPSFPGDLGFWSHT